jgi:hypothetical protein
MHFCEGKAELFPLGEIDLMPIITFFERYSFITVTILHIIHSPVFYLKTRRFGDCVLSSCLGRTYSVGPNR